jgi:hypothetical protein
VFLTNLGLLLLKERLQNTILQEDGEEVHSLFVQKYYKIHLSNYNNNSAHLLKCLTAAEKQLKTSTEKIAAAATIIIPSTSIC